MSQIIRSVRKFQNQNTKYYKIIKCLILNLPLYKMTRKYPLRGYILGVLTHPTAWDRHWRGDETLKLVLVYVAWLLLSYCRNVCNSASSHLMDPKDLVVPKNAYFSLLRHIKQLLFVTLCDTTAGIWNLKVGCRRRGKDRQTWSLK